MNRVGIIFLALFLLTKPKQGTIVKALEAGKHGETGNESSFEDCIR